MKLLINILFFKTSLLNSNSEAFSDPQRERVSLLSNGMAQSPLRKSSRINNEYYSQNTPGKNMQSTSMMRPQNIFNFNNLDNMMKSTVERGSSYTFQNGQPILQKMSMSMLGESKIPQELFLFDMDSIGNYNIFYPHNNVENVLKNLMKNRRKSRRKTIKMQLAKI